MYDSSVLLDVISHVTWFSGPFWPLNRLTGEKSISCGEGSERRSQIFHVDVLSWIQYVYTICLLCFCSQWLLCSGHSPLLPWTSFFTSLWGACIVDRSAFHFSVWFYSKVFNLIHRKQNHSLQKIQTPMFIAILFTVAKLQKQLKCPSMDEWINVINIYHIYI